MSSAKERTLWRILHHASSLPEPERSRHLAEQCQGDAELIAAVQTWIDAQEPPEDFLHHPALGEDFSVAEPAGLARARELLERASFDAAPEGAQELPESIGGYPILAAIGWGGMGVVYRARQLAPPRTIALKVIRAGLYSQRDLDRFRYEAECLARLNHPGIAHIYAAGHDSRSGLPYLAMELVEGLAPLAYVRSAGLDVRRRVELLIEICDAVEHAHQRGIVHADIKPANLLVQADGKPKILDFGVARALCDSSASDAPPIVPATLRASLAYLSPDHLLGAPDAIDTRTDIYALGVLLYELLSGSLPFEFRDWSEAASELPLAVPVPLGQREPSCRGDLEAIAAKCLEKDKVRRYASVSELRNDLRRHLDRLPVEARASGWPHRAWRFVQRNRVAVGLVSAVVLVLAGGIAGTIAQAIEAERQARRATTISQFLREALDAAGHYSAGSRDVKLSFLLESTAARLDKTFPDQPEIRAELADMLGAALTRVGRHQQAEPLLVSAVQARERGLGASHPRTFDSVHNLGILRYHQGRYAEAAELFSRALQGRELALGRDDLDVLRSSAWLGLSSLEQDDLPTAEDHFTRVLDARRRLSASDDPDLFQALSNLARLRKRQGRWAEAEALYREALQGEQAHAAADDPAPWTTSNNLCNLFIVLGRPDDAEPFAVEAVAGLQRTMGVDHPDTLAAKNALATVRGQQGKASEAVALYRELLPIQERVLGPTHPHNDFLLLNLGIALKDTGELAEAESTLREAWQRMQKPEGPQSEGALTAAQVLAQTLSKLGMGEEADALYRRVLSEYTPERARASANYLLAVAGLAGNCKRQGRLDEAEKLLAEAVPEMQQRFTATHRLTLQCRGELALLRLEQGRCAEAETEARAIVAAGQAAQEWVRGYLATVLGQVLARCGQPAQAQRELESGLATLVKTLGSAHPYVDQARAALQELARETAAPVER